MSVAVALAVVLGLAAIGYFLASGPGGGYGKLTASQIAGYASGAGFSGSDLETAVAIALAESGGDPSIFGDNGTSIGLWQIHFTVHPEFDQSRLTDPAYNASAAFSLYQSKGGGFSDWTTYNKGKYLAFLGAAQAAVEA